MGLSVSYGCYDGGYVHFTKWRNEVARAANYKVVENDLHYPLPALKWHLFDDENYLGHWRTPPADPLLVLLVHADDEGVIEARYCLELANRLRELLPRIGAKSHVFDRN